MWSRFVDREITPRFPAGLTLSTSWGSGGIASATRSSASRARSSMIVLPGEDDDNERLDQIVEAYKSRFRQQSVGRHHPAGLRLVLTGRRKAYKSEGSKVVESLARAGLPNYAAMQTAPTAGSGHGAVSSSLPSTGTTSRSFPPTSRTPGEGRGRHLAPEGEAAGGRRSTASTGCAASGANPEFRRCRSALRFERVSWLQVPQHGSCRKDAVLNLLAVAFSENDPPGGVVMLTFSGGGRAAPRGRMPGGRARRSRSGLAELRPVPVHVDAGARPTPRVDARPARAIDR